MLLVYGIGREAVLGMGMVKEEVEGGGGSIVVTIHCHLAKQASGRGKWRLGKF
jgi:hypothetical protein